MLDFRIAIAFARLVGSLTMLGLVFACVLILVGYRDGGELTYAGMSVTDPLPWQLMLLLAAVAATMIPPWWMLQRASTGNHRLGSGRRFS